MEKKKVFLGLLISFIILVICWIVPAMILLKINPAIAFVFGFVGFSQAILADTVFIILNLFFVLISRKNFSIKRGAKLGYIFLIIPFILSFLTYVVHGVQIQNQDRAFTSATELTGRAIDSKDDSFCAQIPQKKGDIERDACYTNVASRLDNLASCDKVVGDNNYGFTQESCRDGVYIERARNKTDIAMCDMIQGIDLKDTCIYQVGKDLGNVPIIEELKPSKGPAGTVVDIVGHNLSGFEGDLDAWIVSYYDYNHKDYSNAAYLPAYGSNLYTNGEYKKIYPGSEVIRVKIDKFLCGQNNSYSGKPCQTAVMMNPGPYRIFIRPWGKMSNSLGFELTQ